MKNIYNYCFAILVACSLFSCKDDEPNVVKLKTEDPVATVESISPVTGYAGAEFTISGTEFGIMKDAIKAYIGETQLEVLSCTENEIVVKVPDGATAGKVTVEVFGQKIATDLMFDVLGEPGVTKVEPVYGFPGDEITFRGHDLGVSKSMYKVIFSGVEELASIVGDPTNEEFVVKVPENAISGMVTLNISDRDVNLPISNGFTVLNHATITGINLDFGYASSEITINGTNLKQDILEGGIELQPIKVLLVQGEKNVAAVVDDENTTENAIVAKLPDDIAVGEYIVYVSTSFEDVPMENPMAFTVKEKPTVTNISSNQALSGSEITLTCNNLEGVTKENVEILFEETPAEVKSVENGIITFVVPVLSKGSYNMSLIINGAIIDLGDNTEFTVLSTPTITSINRDDFLHNETTVLVKEGDEIIITGQEFGSDSENTVLKFGSVEAEIVSINDTEITAKVPDGFESGILSISVNNVETSFDKVTLKKMNTNDDITEYVLRNYKQPFSGVDGFKDQEWDTLKEWQRNNVLSDAGIGCLQYPAIEGGRDQNGAIALHIWGYNNIKNGKLYQITKLPVGKFKVTISGISSGISNGYVRCVFAVFSGNTENQILEYGDSADYPEISGNMLGKAQLAPDVTGEVNFDFTVSGEKMNDVIFSFISWCHNTVWVSCSSVKVEYIE